MGEQDRDGSVQGPSVADQLKAAKEKYGPKTAILYDEDLGQITIACRGRKEAFRRFSHEVKDPKFVTEIACEEFCRAVVVEVNDSSDPATVRSKLNQMFEDAPQAGVTIALRAKQLFEGDFKELGKD